MFRYLNTRDLKIREKYEPLFRRNIIEESSIWLKYIYFFSSLFITILLFLSLTNIIIQSLWFDFIMIGILVMFLVLIGLLHIAQKSKRRVLQEVIVNIMYIFTMLATGSLAIFGFSNGSSSQLLLYAVGLFISSIMVIKQPLATLFIYIIIHFAFTITLFVVIDFEGIYLNDQIYLILVVFTAITISIIRYNFFRKNFIVKIKMQELNTSLKNL